MNVESVDRSRFRPQRSAFRTVKPSKLLHHFTPGVSRPLTIVAAPAGFGKTTLLNSVFQNLEKDNVVVWLTLEEEDRGAHSFLELLTMALLDKSIIDNSIKKQILDYLADGKKSWKVSVKEIVAQLIAYPRQITLLIDNYHCGESELLNDVVSLLIQRVPSEVQFVIASRTLPGLPLGRFRAAGGLREIYKEDLCFTLQESSDFFSHSHSLNLSHHELHAIHSAVHGWAVGLQLAALAIKQEQKTPTTAKFTLRHSSVIEYLDSELLSNMSVEEKAFFLMVAPLSRLSDKLCIEITGNENAAMMLKRMDRHFLILSTLDNEKKWFSFHPVFSDYLQYLTRSRSHEETKEIHRKAYKWFAGQNMLMNAVDHCVKAHDFEEMVELVEQCRHEIMMQGHVRILDEWLNLLPRKIFMERPTLRLAKCWILLWRRECDTARAILESVENDIRGGLLDKLEVSDELRIQINSNIIATQYILAYFSDDWQEISRIDKEEGEPETPAHSAHSGVVHNIRTYCHYTMGRFDAARRSAAAARPIHVHCGNISGEIFLDCFLGLVNYEELHLDEACKHFTNAFKLAYEQASGSGVITSFPATLLAQYYYEIDEIDQAQKYLDIALPYTNEYSNFENVLISAHINACLHYLKGDLEMALDSLARAEAFGREGHSERIVASALCLRLKILLLTGDDLSANDVIDEINTMQLHYGPPGKAGWPKLGFELACAQARWCIANKEWRQAISLLTPLLATVRTYTKKLRLVKVLILLTAAKAGTGQIDTASAHLGEVFELSIKAQLYRTIIDDIYLIQDVMEHAVANFEELRAKKLGFKDMDGLLAFMQRVGIKVPDESSRQLSKADIIEPLSPREEAVLQSLSLGKTNRSIAESLGIAESTVAWHMKNIFQKMWVTNRAEAIAKATRLGLAK